MLGGQETRSAGVDGITTDLFAKVAQSIANLETSDYSLANQFIPLNQWNY